MTTDEIKELIHAVQESGIAELIVQDGSSSVTIRRVLPAVVTAVQGPVQLPGSAGEAPTGETPAPDRVAGDNNTGPTTLDTIVKSPIVGTYYDSPAPDAAPFVKVGDQVEPGTVLCIIESMKLMNEIESEIAGTVITKMVENGKPVEYGESLFAIRPR
jgi:acetyl-CoA carboxylase biotin carboxyl carrier protein